ncbi:PREDICTED: normal mucosa of esophagus-specific gene 1 protein-like [Priapulus caudatus]|uniref:Normal mucosa of esophagus-specific gene 1 protein-like n=1 Tax=Priapulus caudatus TaxID=37621 RepID=A0ABM1E1Z4_PRICU|nr:PREDICTED: normal mucosa of esophagus-specific gene 1 protein-like [Priapulus caudatus]XP_014666215.1 PREDICTED: normal mucosa of esophagus-specific gene 1 protein-like [Priapulus caudatus]
MSRSMNSGMKTFGFGLRAMKKHPEIIPVTVILGIACTGAIAYPIYSLFFKTDVTIDGGRTARWDSVNPEKPQKFLTFGQEYKSNPEVEKLRAEIA